MRRVKIDSANCHLAKRCGIDATKEYNYWFAIRGTKKVHFFETLDGRFVYRTTSRLLPELVSSDSFH